jgi:hypothetical protein
MLTDFFDPTREQQNVVLIDTTILHEAEQLIESCEGCNEDGAEIPFDNILDRVTGSDPSVTDYVLERRRSVQTVGVRSLKRRSSNRSDQTKGSEFLSFSL